VLLWLAKKAFLGKVPFPLVHIDTTFKIPEMIAYRDEFVRAQGLDLIVGKNERALAAGILCFNIESAPELERIDAVARRLGKRARISVRVNPDVDAGTHPYISTGLKNNKFGVAFAETLPLYRDAARRSGIEIVGIDCHIGSQITDIEPYIDAADRVLDVVDALARDGISLHHIDFGGGLGIRYDDEVPPATEGLVQVLLSHVDRRGHGAKTVMFEPGRSIVGNAGVLLTRVEYLKHGETKNFAIVDAAMNDLARPTMYDAWMGVVPVAPRADAPVCYDVVGPVCESGDWLARDRLLAVLPGDLLAVTSAGAYGMAMSSNYNTRGRAAEVMVDGGRAFLVRTREQPAQLFAGESRLP
jgi:diaminopimelate decarboxylase